MLERLQIFNETKLLKVFKFLKTVGLVKIGIQELVPGELELLDRKLCLKNALPQKLECFIFVILIF